MAEHLHDAGVMLAFSGLKHQVMEIFRNSGLVEVLGPEAMFSNKEEAMRVLDERWPPTADEWEPPAEIDSTGGEPQGRIS